MPNQSEKDSLRSMIEATCLHVERQAEETTLKEFTVEKAASAMIRRAIQSTKQRE